MYYNVYIHNIWACGRKVIIVEDDACSYLGENEGTTGAWLL